MSSVSRLDKHLDAIRDRLAEGDSQRKLAAEFGVARATLQNFIRTRLEAPPSDTDDVIVTVRISVERA